MYKNSKFRWSSIPNNAGMKNYTDLNFGEVICLSIIYHSAWFLMEWLRFLFRCKPPIELDSSVDSQMPFPGSMLYHSDVAPFLHFIISLSHCSTVLPFPCSTLPPFNRSTFLYFVLGASSWPAVLRTWKSSTWRPQLQEVNCFIHFGLLDLWQTMFPWPYKHKDQRPLLLLRSDRPFMSIM